MSSYTRISKLNRHASNVFAAIQGAENKELVKALFLEVDELQNKLGSEVKRHGMVIEEGSVLDELELIQERVKKSWMKEDIVDGSPAQKRQRRES